MFYKKYEKLPTATLESIIAQEVENLKKYENYLAQLPQDTFLGRLGFKAEIRSRRNIIYECRKELMKRGER